MNKHIGLVKWFHDQSRNANYGFIEHSSLGDIFFHENNINEKEDIQKIKENTIVIFSTKESSKKKGESEALDVELLSSATNQLLIFSLYISLLGESSNSQSSRIIYELYTRSKLLAKSGTDDNSKEEMYSIFKDYISNAINSTSSFSIVKKIITICGDIFKSNYEGLIATLESKVSVEVAHELWFNDLFKSCQIDYIANNILSENETIQRKIIKKSSNVNRKEIISLLLSNIFNESPPSLNNIKSILNLCSNSEVDEYDDVINRCTPYYKLVLWLEDYHQNLNFDEFKQFTVVLSPDNQKLFVKKVLKYIHEGIVNITVEEFTSINTVDYATSKFLKESDNIKLDYSTSIVLSTLLELHNQNRVESRQQEAEAKRKIFDIILNQLSNPADILEIKGYFDECKGRCVPTIKDGELIDFERNRYQIPELHSEICDGRKFMDKTGSTVLCDRFSVEFWWCANQKCYTPSRELHSSDEWMKYTLLDFLTILKVHYQERDFEMYLNIINKVNRFLKHLKCRGCDSILRPVKKSNYAFYGVNNFSCNNTNCDEFEKPIYLTHCLNGRCDHNIDSRDSAKCLNSWYICNYCYSCCTTDIIQSRIRNMQQRGIEFKGNTVGHLDTAEIFCTKCGNKMLDSVMNIDDFNSVLNWFISNKSGSPYISKSGITKNNKNWFMFTKYDQSIEEYRSKLLYYLSLGFNVPNIKEEGRFNQLISEPYSFEENSSDILKCNSCNHILDLSSDRERSFIIKKFHRIRYPE